MPTIVGILIFMSRINIIFSLVEHEKAKYQKFDYHMGDQ